MDLLGSWSLPPQWHSTRLRIAAAFTVLALLLFTGVGGLSGQQARRESEREAGVTLRQLAQRLALALDSGMAERFREVQNLGRLESLIGTEIDAAGWRALVDRLQSSYPYYSWIGVADARGQVMAGTGGLLEGRDVSQRPWFAQGLQRPFVGDVHEAALLAALLPKRADGEPIRLVDFSTPLRDGERVTGVLGAHLSWRWAEDRYREVLASIDPERRVEIEVLGAQRELLLGAKPSRTGDLSAETLAALRERPRILRAADGRRYLYAVAHGDGDRGYPGVDWTVLVRQPVETALAAADALERRIWAFGVLGAALFGLAGGWLASRLTAPLRAVAQHAQRAAADGVQADRRSHDEVALLATSIDTLVEQLHRRERELSGISDTIEARVEQRTLSLQERNEDLQSFSRSVSHDLKGPIGSMGMVLRHVLEEEGARLGESPRRVLGEVARECERLRQLIDELLTLAMVEQRPLSTAPVPMRALVDKVLSELRAVPGGARVAVQVDELPDVQGDEILLRQVWQNLLANAFKFSAKAALPRVRISAQREGDELVFTVKDNGVGFDMIRAGRLFGVFQRLHRSSEFPGTGVGLSIVKRVVQRHGGRVGARSQPGDGAEFYFALPAARPGSEAQ